MIMENTYWRKQQPNQPLFPDMIWSRPEHKSAAGKLLIVGGNLYGFSAAAEAYQLAQKAGAGHIKVLLPDALSKTVGRILENGQYAPSTPSGSFSQKALAELLDLAAWSDAVLLAGELGRNSETAILLEKFVLKFSGQLTATTDAADYLIGMAESIKNRPNTLLVISFAQLQKLATQLKFTKAFTFEMDTLRFVKLLRELTLEHSLMIMTSHQGFIHAALGGQIISTPTSPADEVWRLKTATNAAVWWMQNPEKPLEALTTSLWGDI